MSRQTIPTRPSTLVIQEHNPSSSSSDFPPFSDFPATCQPMFLHQTEQRSIMNTQMSLEYFPPPLTYYHPASLLPSPSSSTLISTASGSSSSSSLPGNTRFSVQPPPRQSASAPRSIQRPIKCYSESPLPSIETYYGFVKDKLSVKQT
ncbi:hypothetical protein BCR33DRAFT_717097 [Rhizoclosmatium globosum]|uniref:Uncharacterized protein n=1 Tax=Rhizoclosmatium globosum TaxID=329046 RepID=A0A1Y2CAB7_9FUNG|nr:hypothetical protein BCR33DRAFT_717097 [Rhizoclosmatium globosum]|eukprot:ORY43971.1 hypothetical protein BCR33DRAFT_717097 [Rhizoclosmatium globosum]